ncbi:SPOR domain-containing protein [Pararhizobium gei]|uniref:SPOR domain-containing protein n=1 Tax=Pararhizobium gei TaxID=1395951 RepID=UPI0023DC64C2|nr:SPOR domain-containing protein [Rhizobium gei]
MADKQLARSETADFNVLADDDPLAELARIVGYDNRPAVQQLQELERHRELVRKEPEINLEDELLREFHVYDAPNEAVRAPQLVDAVAQAAPVVEQAPLAVVAEPVRVEPELSSVKADQETDAALSTGQPLVKPAGVPASELSYEAIDLERELEMSISYDDYYGQSEPAAEPAAATPVEHRIVDAPAVEPENKLAIPVETTPVETTPVETAPVETAPVENVLVETASAEIAPVDAVPVAGAKDQDAVARQADPVTVDGSDPGKHAVSPSNSGDVTIAAGDAQGIDDLLADIERFPVPPLPAARVAAVAEPVRKVNYPFTPTFSRATPVASAGGSQKAFATPLAAVPVSLPVTPVVAETASVPAEIMVSPVVTEAAPQLKAAIDQDPDFDLDSFELDLSEIDLAIEPVESAPVQPMTATPAPLAVETVETQVFDAPVADDDDADIEPESMLPFDPAMIADSEENPVAITDLHVPQLPVVEQERPVAHHPDYDLDLDAEMAQLFGAPNASVASSGKNGRDIGAAALPHSSQAQPSGRASPVEEDFEEFEKAMEADFRLSLSQRHETDPSQDRLAVGSGYVADTQYDDERQGRGKRRLVLMAATVAGLAIFGGAGVYAFMNHDSSALSAGEPKIILADKTPVKMVPLEKGGKTVPNQDKAVYDRVAGAQDPGPSQDTLVSSTEEPMDVVQRTLTPENLPLEGAGEELPGLADEDQSERLLPDGQSAENMASDDAVTPAVAPRKVRTMIVKPDGTLVAREETAVVPSTETAAVSGRGDPQVKTVKTTSITAPVETGSTPKALSEGQAIEPAQKTALEEAAAATVEEVAPVRSVKTSAVADPIPQARPVEEAKVVDTFKTEPAQKPVETKPVETAAVAPGTYVIQIASLPSEAEAQRSFKSLSGKFGGVIKGKGVDIKKAEIAGKGTYFRVRIPAGTRQEANALCSRYKSAGGSCLVTK